MKNLEFLKLQSRIDRVEFNYKIKLYKEIIRSYDLQLYREEMNKKNNHIIIKIISIILFCSLFYNFLAFFYIWV